MCLLSWSLSAWSANDMWQVSNIYGPSQVGIVANLPVELNGDGYMDVVSLSYEDGHLRLYQNQGGQGFTERIVDTTLLGGYRMSVTDFNGDQNPDFLLTSLETDQIILMVAEAGGYRKQIVADRIALPFDALAADINQDGLMDVVSLSLIDDQINLHEQLLSGQFTSRVIANDVSQPRKLLIEDFTGDSKPEILVVSSGDDSVRMYSYAAGEFSVRLLSADVPSAVNVIGCHLNDDQLMDFVVAAAGNDSVHKFINFGAKQFNQSVLNIEILGVNGLACEDIDDDGELELMTVSSVQSIIRKHEFSGDPQTQMVANARDGYITLALADFNNDGVKSLLTQSFFEHRVLLYDVAEVNAETVVWELFPDGAYQAKAVDLDADGDEDVVGVSLRDDHVFWLENIQGNYALRTISRDVDGPQSIAVGDLDADGDLDLVTAGAWDDKFWLHSNQGNATFNSQVIFDGANNAARAVIDNITGDAANEVVISSSLDNSIRLLEPINGQFVVRVLDDDLTGAYDIKVMDVDGNGLKDIVANGLRDPEVKLYSQTQAGVFLPQVIFNDAIRSNALQLFDLVVDGLPDVSIINDKRLVSLNNMGQGIFTPLKPFYAAEGLWGFSLVELSEADAFRMATTADTGVLEIVDFSGLQETNRWQDQSRFISQYVVNGAHSHAFYTTSTVDNVVKSVINDLIMASDFELQP